MTDTVVITRPLAQAGALARRIKAGGRAVVILPLLEIEALSDTRVLEATLAGLAQYAMVVFVSPNAVDAAFRHIAQWPPGVALAVLGEGSRAALAGHGVGAGTALIFSPPEGASSDSENLLKTLDLAALRGQNVLIVRGENGRDLLGDALSEAGVLVTMVAAYRRSVPLLSKALNITLRTLLEQKNDWIVTSSEALRGLIGLLEEIDREAIAAPEAKAGISVVVKMKQQHLIVPHARIAETANSLGFTQLTLTGSGDARLLAALQLRS